MDQVGKRIYNANMCLKDAGGITNTVDHDKQSGLGLQYLLKPDVQLLRIFIIKGKGFPKPNSCRV